MYCKTLFVGGGGGAVWGATTLQHAEKCDDVLDKGASTTEHVTHFVREAFVAFPGHGPTFWILNVLAIIVGINTIAYAMLALWKMRPRRSRPIIDAKYENYTPYGEPATVS